MNTIKIGTFPGRLNDYALENGTTVKDALDMANIEVSEEQEIKLDGRTVNTNDVIDGGSTLLVTKRIKGNK